MSRSEFLLRLGRDPTQPLAVPEEARPSIPWQWQYAKPGPYVTQLDPQQEAEFQQWVQANQVPFDPSPTSDYDMRGFWLAARQGDPRAQTSINPNDNRIHFSDPWKTPYHISFSNESIYALPHAPRWNERDQLIDPHGNIVFDEPAWVQKQYDEQGAERKVNQVGFQSG